jgi:hypothetical protein
VKRHRTKGEQLKFKEVKDSSPPVFEAKGTDNKVYSFENVFYICQVIY